MNLSVLCLRTDITNGSRECLISAFLSTLNWCDPFCVAVILKFVVFN